MSLSDWAQLYGIEAPVIPPGAWSLCFRVSASATGEYRIQSHCCCPVCGDIPIDVSVGDGVVTQVCTHLEVKIADAVFMMRQIPREA